MINQNKYTYAESEATFGSVVRGDNDSLSDRDIIIVDDNIDILRERRAVLENEGWSVSSYTFGKITAMANKKVLFVQHLKLQSEIINDRNLRLTNLLNDFTPKPSYETEALDNRKMTNLIRTVPKTNLGGLWAADVLYVALRNFGILVLAGHGKYVFGFAEILDELIELGFLKHSNRSACMKLRFLKSLYRSGETINLGISLDSINHSLADLPTDYFVTKSEAMVSNSVLTDMRPLNSEVSPYLKLRNIEKAYICMLDLHQANGKIGKFEELGKWIKDPSHYSHLVSKTENELMEELVACAHIPEYLSQKLKVKF